MISLHGGGSPEAMKMEIWRNYPLGNKVDLVERLLERGVAADGTRALPEGRDPARCCVEGCGLVSRLARRPPRRQFSVTYPSSLPQGRPARPATLIEP